MSRQNFGRRINAWLQEAPGEQFRDGKWRFWFPVVVGFQLLNSILTVVVFGSGGQLQQYMFAVLLGVGALLAWLCVGLLHYSDSSDRGLARGVSALDSSALLFVVAHFCFLLWVYGHLTTLQNAEATYKREAELYNAEAKSVSADNVAIAQAAQAVAQETTKAEKLRNDTAYQQRKAAEAGRGIPLSRRQTPTVSTPGLATSAVELEKPQKPPESSATFLTRWDSWIRIANFGELLLAVATLIYIRNQSAKTNSPRVVAAEDEFPDTLEIENRLPIRREKFSPKKEPAKNHGSFNFEGLKRLREALRDISFRLKGLSFKSKVKGDAVWIFLMKANNGTQETIHSVKAKLDILDDAMRMERTAFRERLENFLRQNGFEI